MKLFQKHTDYLRSLRLGYWLHNITHYQTLRSNTELYKILGVKKKVWQSMGHADIAKLGVEKSWLDSAISTAEIQHKKGFDQFDKTSNKKYWIGPARVHHFTNLFTVRKWMPNKLSTNIFARIIFSKNLH